MSTDFADYESLVSEVVDDVHGEPVRFVAMLANQYTGRSADPDRPDFETIGVFDRHPVMAQAVDKGQYDGYQPNLSADRVHISVQEEHLTGWRPKTGDQIYLLDQLKSDNQPKAVTIKDEQPDGIGRVVFVCAWV